jgi:hypothetical protein
MGNHRWTKWALGSVVGLLLVGLGGAAHAAGPPLPITCQPGEVAVVANLHAGSTWFELDDQFIVQETALCRPIGSTIDLHAPVGQFDYDGNCRIFEYYNVTDWDTAQDAPGQVFDRDVPAFRVDRNLLIVAVFREPQFWEYPACYQPA